MNITDIQRHLSTLGFDPGPIDGFGGPRTIAAIRAFPSARGLLVDGIVGPQARGALAAAMADPSPAPAAALVPTRRTRSTPTPARSACRSVAWAAPA